MARTAGIVLDLFARTQHERYGPHRQHRADLYVPRDGDGPSPVVILIHGGYWRAVYGKIVMKPLAADLVRRGYAAWNIEYRRIGRHQGGGYPMTFDDVANAIDHLAELDDPRLDLDDVTLLGHSSGGHLALWSASRDDASVTPQRVIAQAPITNLVACGPPAYALMGGEPREHPDRYAQCDPMQLLPLGLPLLSVHGPADATIPLERTREYAAAARAAGDDVTLLEPETGGHRSHLDPRSEAWRAAVEWLSEQRSTLPRAAH
ncbi:MAG TPA: alpha/beta hydrolase [Thermoleophilaceae bacterium]|nr:alpha/beta hydrolase [Thermoleophilaceae bacterium]